MTLGKSPTSEDAFRSGAVFCRDRVSETSIYGLLYRESHHLFPDETFADLFADIGRTSVPPRIVAVVMVLQRLEGLSDREAVDRITFDLRWKYAAGGLDYDYAGFVHTVLVDMRARLRRSERPNRIFEIALEVARDAGLIGRKRVMDSTALYDAVATQDTVTLIRSAIRALLKVVDDKLGAELRACCKRDDDYVAAGKPSCDWDDAEAREALVDALARDAYAILATLDDRKLDPAVTQAAKLVATVVGQDLEQREDGMFRIARRVAPDRVISVVDPEARHGHKTAARGFDGYKGHIAIDPDSEIITATEVTPGNASDGSVAEALLADVLSSPAKDDSLAMGESTSEPAARVEVFGDASYGTADLVEKIEAAGADANVKVQGPSAPLGHFGKDAFEIDLDARTVKCPAGVLVQIRTYPSDGVAKFAAACSNCSLRARCTDAKAGREIRIHPKEATLQRYRAQQRSPTWKQHYRATRPKVERKLAHLMLRRHGGRRARVRGTERSRHDFALLGAAHNLARLARLGVRFNAATWSC
ncbi:MAG: IS1182 family transposase [Kofleriaceae bacterium]